MVLHECKVIWTPGISSRNLLREPNYDWTVVRNGFVMEVLPPPDRGRSGRWRSSIATGRSRWRRRGSDLQQSARSSPQDLEPEDDFLASWRMSTDGGPEVRRRRSEGDVAGSARDSAARADWSICRPRQPSAAAEVLQRERRKRPTRHGADRCMGRRGLRRFRRYDGRVIVTGWSWAGGLGRERGGLHTKEQVEHKFQSTH